MGERGRFAGPPNGEAAAQDDGEGSGDYDDSVNPQERLREALVQLRKAAAAQEVRRARVAAELARLEEQAGSGDGPADAGLAEQLEAVRGELARAEEDLRVSRSKLEEAPKLVSQLERATLLREVQALAQSDPFDPTAEEVALDNVRGAARELDAQAEVGDHRSKGRPEPEAEREARAREELARLKAERKAKK